MGFSEIFKGTKGQPLSKKLIITVVGAFIAPWLESRGVNHDTVMSIMQVFLGYIGVQGAVDFAQTWKGNGPAPIPVPVPTKE